MKIRSFLKIGLVLLAMIALTGCKAGSGDVPDTDSGVIIQADPDPEWDSAGNVGQNGDSDASLAGGQQGEADPDSGEIDNSDAIQDLLDEIDELNLGEDEDLPEWLVEAGKQIEITVSVVNLCGVDIGMVSTIDPFSEEQIDLGPLPADKLINISQTWPVDKTTYDLAIYNVNGDLVSVTEVDITGIKEKVTITLSGNGDLENIDSLVE